MIIAHRFIGGIEVCRNPTVREGANVLDMTADLQIGTLPDGRVSAVVCFTDSFALVDAYPALKCWAIFKRPLLGLIVK